MTGDGATKLLGKPPLTTLATLVREAVQNAWDARAQGQRVRFSVSLRHLEPEQVVAMRNDVFAQLPASKASRAPLEAELSKERPLLLEISDFGTVGLGGPTRADAAVTSGQSRRFVNLVVNIGSASNGVQWGGTYGLGKI